jgi:predicted ATPase
MADLFLREVILRRETVPDFRRYPFSLPAVSRLDRFVFDGPVTFFIGENGSGKSTLLEAFAVALGFNPEGGSRHFRFATRASHSALHEHLRTVRGIVRPRDGYFLRAESYFNVATEIERLDEEPAQGPPIADAYGERALHEQSHGESFLALVQNRLRGHGYQLDGTGMKRIAYEETEHFRVTRDFLNRYPTMLRSLLDDDDAVGSEE